VSPTSGTVLAGQGEQVTATFDTTGMSFDATQTGTLTLASPNADNATLSVPVTLVAANVALAWSFAEGTTAGSFQTYITVSNPNATVANVVYSYYLDSGQQPIRVKKVVPPNSRATENVNTDIGPGHAVSMTVASDVGIVAERPMYFNFRGIPGGTDILGATGYANTFDFGYLDTTPGHTTFLTILNPDALVDMDAQVTFFPASGGTPISFTRFVPHSTRGTIGLNTDVPGLPPGAYSATVSLFEHGQAAPLEGLVERPMYLKDSVTGYTGSADVMGVPSTQTAWYFAEGTTSSTFSERYILSNPCLPADAGGCGATLPADAVVTFYMPDGSTKTAAATLAPGQQQVIDANKVLGNGVANSALVTAKSPILAERFMSFSYHGIPGATDVLGASAPRDLFFFAEGAASSSFTEFLTIENPGTQAAIVNVTFLPADGSTPVVRTYTVTANSRFTLKTNDVISGSFSMVVESNGVPIVAERPMYFVYHGADTGGTDIIGYAP
jgi:hypothetical protein